MKPSCALSVILLLSALAVGPAAAFNSLLSSDRLVVTLSRATGQVVGIAEKGGGAILAASEDRYDFNDRLSSESKDVVISGTSAKNRATFQCVNRDLGLAIAKTYRLRGAVLEKEVRYTSDLSEKLLLRVSSKSVIEPTLYSTGYFYVPIDDGYKVVTLPLIPAVDMTKPTPWTISVGAFVYYFPSKDLVFAHYRYKVNGGFIYGEADRAIESKFLPGGAITALGEGFVDKKSALSLVSHYALIDGDPRDYHKHILARSPYVEHRRDPMPKWINNVRMIYFYGDTGCGIGLANDREAVGRDVMDLMKLIDDDENLMVFFNHWSMSGDYPYSGDVRYFTYTAEGWSKPVPVENMRRNIAWLKSLSPRIKVGGYVYMTPAVGTRAYKEHDDWLLHDKQGNVMVSGDGIGEAAIADFTTGYTDYALDQLQNMVKTLGFDWIHMDYGPTETVNWGTKSVSQTWASARLFDELAKFCAANNSALVQNVAWTTALWAHAGYVEVQQPDRWSKRDWRTMAAPGYLSCLYRTVRPGTWLNLVYGCGGEYGRRNAQTGLRGWIRGPNTWWQNVSQSLAYEKVIDELLETRLCDARVHPSWWRLETDRLEAEALQKGEGIIIPIMLHKGAESEQTISLKTSEMGFNNDSLVFGFDLKLSPPYGLDPFKPAPWKIDYIELAGFEVGKLPNGAYSHRIRLEPSTNYYHVVTQVPAWVYSYNGKRASLILPEIRGVKISGSLKQGAQRYKLAVRNGNKRAEIVAYVPGNWRHAAVDGERQESRRDADASVRQEASAD